VSTRAQAMRNSLFSSVGIYTEYFLGMLASIIIARHLGPHDFGTYSLVVWFVAIGVTATNSGT
jgi:O-antigen/teichoic acid export membrane protein